MAKFLFATVNIIEWFDVFTISYFATQLKFIDLDIYCIADVRACLRFLLAFGRTMTVLYQRYKWLGVLFQVEQDIIFHEW